MRHCYAICILILISLVACSPDSATSDSRIFTVGEGTGVLSVNPYTGEVFGWEVEGTQAAVSYNARQVAYIHKNAWGQRSWYPTASVLER